MSPFTDVFINRMNMKPFWVFRDIHEGKNFGGSMFLCFINHHFPEEMVSNEEEVNKRGAAKLKDGTWKLEALKGVMEGTKVGWGCGKTPQEAFRNACYNSGHLKSVNATT